TSLMAQTATVRRDTNLRPSPSTEETRIELLKPSARVTVLKAKTRNGYRFVRVGDADEGWALAKNLVVPELEAPGPPVAAAARPAAAPPGDAFDFPLADPDTIEPRKYAMHSSCPPNGDEDVRDDGGQRNLAKRFMAGGTLTPLTVNNFKALQTATDKDAVDHKTKRDKLTLKDIEVASTKVSEGDMVSVSGFLNHADNGSKQETVNCKTPHATKDGQDLHINIGPEPNGDEFAGIVVEMITQLPVGDFEVPARTDAKSALTRVKNQKLRVLAIGSLTYDNEHTLAHVNGQPKRMSLWEIHPVLQFFVCPEGKSCDATDKTANWVELSKWAKANPN